jgi:hypothetical protein
MNNSSKIGALHSDPKMPNDFKLNIHLWKFVLGLGSLAHPVFFLLIIIYHYYYMKYIFIWRKKAMLTWIIRIKNNLLNSEWALTLIFTMTDQKSQ